MSRASRKAISLGNIFDRLQVIEDKLDELLRRTAPNEKRRNNRRLSPQNEPAYKPSAFGQYTLPTRRFASLPHQPQLNTQPLVVYRGKNQYSILILDKPIYHLPPGAKALPINVVARVLSCNRQKIAELIDEGQLEGFDLRCPGASRALIRITADSVESFMEKHQTRKRARKRARISPTRTRRSQRPADALLAALRES